MGHLADHICALSVSATDLAFAKPLRQESKRMAANNGEVLTTHLATLSKIIEENSLTASRVFNLDECGSAPEKDLNGNTASRRFLPKRRSRDYRVNNFAYLNRITMMPVISAAGHAGPPLFVFKGSRIPYRTVIKNRVAVTETPACKLPDNATLALRNENGGVDSLIFMNWAFDFVDYVKPLTRNGQKVLLVYDAYRAHISLDVLDILHEANVIVYALPAHTSGRTQPLDVVLFSVFKAKLNFVLSSIVPLTNTESLDLFDICGILREAYYSTFTATNIIAGFRRSGIWPLDYGKLLCESVPASSECDAVMLTVDELVDLFERKREEYRNKVLGSDAVIGPSGYVDTTNGCVMTSSTVLQLVREKQNRDQRKFMAEKEAEQKKEAKEIRRRLVVVQRRHLIDTERIERQAKLAGMSVESFVKGRRSLKERRLAARRNAEAKSRANRGQA